jgi:hypothetical protein
MVTVFLYAQGLKIYGFPIMYGSMLNTHIDDAKQRIISERNNQDRGAWTTGRDGRLIEWFIHRTAGTSGKDMGRIPNCKTSWRIAGCLKIPVP